MGGEEFDADEAVAELEGGDAGGPAAYEGIENQRAWLGDVAEQLAHLLIFFKYLGVRDSTGQPVANILNQQGAPNLNLMGYPVEPLQIAPSATAVDTVFALFGALRRACRVYRHRNAVALKSSDQVKWLEAETVVASDGPQDMTIVNGDGVVQLKTAAA